MRLITLLLLFWCLLPLHAQRNIIHDTENFRSLQLIVRGDPLLSPILEWGKSMSMSIEFDEMSHDYRRLYYHIDHCEADWSVSDEIFESYYLAGLNDQLIEDYEKSFNTNQIYTHYRLRLPQQDTRVLLSGNYRVSIYDEDDDDKTPLLSAEFCVVDKRMNTSIQVTDNTDIDFQREHQQLSIALGYGSLRVNDPYRELQVFVTQNRRPDLRIQVKPNMLKNGGCEFTHLRDLIFPAGNECHNFEVLDVRRSANIRVDNMRWYAPYYHATLYEERPTHNYVYQRDQNGAFVIRNIDNEDNHITSEYVFVHFRLKTPPITSGGPIYVQGNWANNWPDDAYKMEYDQEAGEYHAAIYLKQGYYDYRFLQVENGRGTSTRTDGNFYQTENEYQVLVYYKPLGSRYTQLVGFTEAKKQ